MPTGLEGSLDPGGGDDRVIAEPVVVQGEDAVGEHHDLAPDDGARAEREVEEVLAVEADAEQRALLHAGRRQVPEVRVARRRALLELAAAEEGERHADALGDVDVGAEPVAGLAALDLVGAQVDAQVRMRLDARPEHRREVEEGRGLEVAGALEVVLVARRQAELETRGRTDATLQLGQLVLAAQQDVAHADRIAPGGAGARRLGGGAETLLAGQLLLAHLALDAHAEIRVDDGDEQVDVQVVEHAVGEAERADVAVDLEAVTKLVGGPPEQVPRRVELLDDDQVRRREPLDAAAVELVELHVLVADVHVELAPPERVRPLEEDWTEGLRRAFEDLELRVVAVRVTRGRRDDGEVAGRRVG